MRSVARLASPVYSKLKDARRSSSLSVLAAAAVGVALTVLVLLVAQPSLLGVANTSAVLCHWQPHNASSQAAAAVAAPSPATELYGGVLLPSQQIAAALHNLATFRTATTQKAPATNTTWLQLSLDLEGALASLSPQQLQTLLMLHDKDLCAASDAAGPEGRALVLGGAKSRAVAVSGINMHVYDNADIVSGFLSAGTAWEAKEINWMLWALKAPLPAGAPRPSSTGPPVMVDIGANVGWFALNAARAGARVYAFEGMPDNVALIRASMCANPQLAPSITLFPLGLGPDNTTCWVVAGDGNKGDGFTKCGPKTAKEAESFFSEGYHARGSMLVRKLDDLMHEDVKVLKMDVEGFESNILAGGQQFFGAHNVYFMIVEANPGIIGDKGVQQLQQQLMTMGYRISDVGFTGPWIPEANVKAGLAKMQDVNLYAVKDRMFANGSSGR